MDMETYAGQRRLQEPRPCPCQCKSLLASKQKSWNFTRGSTSPTPLETAVLSTTPPPNHSFTCSTAVMDFCSICQPHFKGTGKNRESMAVWKLLSEHESEIVRKTAFACEIISPCIKSNKNSPSAFSEHYYPKSQMDGVEVKDNHL